MTLSPGEEKRVLHICGILEKTWGMGKKKHHFLQDPLDGLIQTILSQNTNDKNRDRAYARLVERFSSWEDVAAAEDAAVRECIAVAGISAVKTRYIKNVLGEIRKTFGSCSLGDLSRWSCEKSRGFLEGLPGVGPKTAACVLLFQLGCPAFPVDTHVTRLARRLGVAQKKDAPHKIEGIFFSFLPEDRFLEVHLNLITHGRNICFSRNPRCGKCVVREFCPFPEQ